MYWIGPLAVGAGVTVSVVFKQKSRTSADFRLKVDKAKLRMPVFGSLFQKLAMSRFARNLGLLLNVGVPVMQALTVVGETTGNEVINLAMKDVQAAVRDGHTMSSALRHHKIFPTMVTQMIEVGEESGQISQMLEKVADFYDREVDSAAESLTASIEPDHGPRHGCRGRRNGDLSLPTDVHHLPKYPEQLTLRNLHQTTGLPSVEPGARARAAPIPSHPDATGGTPNAGHHRAAPRPRRDDDGFTLIELLVVVVIIGVLVAIAVPVYLNYRQGAADKSAQSDVRGAVSAVEQWYTDKRQPVPDPDHVDLEDRGQLQHRDRRRSRCQRQHRRPGHPVRQDADDLRPDRHQRCHRDVVQPRRSATCSAPPTPAAAARSTCTTAPRADR